MAVQMPEHCILHAEHGERRVDSFTYYLLLELKRPDNSVNWGGKTRAMGPSSSLTSKSPHKEFSIYREMGGVAVKKVD